MNKHFNFFLFVYLTITLPAFAMQDPNLDLIDQEVANFENRLQALDLEKPRTKISLSQEIRDLITTHMPSKRTQPLLTSSCSLSSSLESESLELVQNNDDVTSEQVQQTGIKVTKKKKRTKKDKNNNSDPKRPVTDLDRFIQELVEHRFDNAQTILIDKLNFKKLNDVLGSEKRTPLLFAISKNDYPILEKLLLFGADADTYSPCPELVAGSIRITPFCAALMYGQLDMAQLLLKYKANITLGTKDVSNNRITNSLTCVTQTLVSTPGSILTTVLQKKLVQFLLNNGATQFDGKIIFMDHGSKNGTVIDMDTSMDRTFYKKLYSAQDQVNKIYCHKGDIILLGGPLTDELEQVVKDRKEPVDLKKLIARKVTTQSKALMPLLSVDKNEREEDEDELSTTSEVIEASEGSDNDMPMTAQEMNGFLFIDDSEEN